MKINSIFATMDEYFNFIDFNGLSEVQVETLKLFLHPSTINPNVELPWEINLGEEDDFNLKENISFVNSQVTDFRATATSYVSPTATEVYAAKFPCMLSNTSGQIICHIDNSQHLPAYGKPSGQNVFIPSGSISNPILPFPSNVEMESHAGPNVIRNPNASQVFAPEVPAAAVNTYGPPPPVLHNRVHHIQSYTPSNVNTKSFQLNPMVSCFVPQNINFSIYTAAPTSIHNGVPPVSSPHMPLQSPPMQAAQTMPERSSYGDSKEYFYRGCGEAMPTPNSPLVSESKKFDLAKRSISIESKRNEAEQETAAVLENVSKTSVQPVNKHSAPMDSSQNIAAPVVNPLQNVSAHVNHSQSFANAAVNHSQSFAAPVVNHSQSFATPVVNQSQSFATPVVNQSQSFATPVVNHPSPRIPSSVVNHSSLSTVTPVVNHSPMSVASPVINHSSLSMASPAVSQSTLAMASPAVTQSTLTMATAAVSQSALSMVSPAISQSTLSMATPAVSQSTLSMATPAVSQSSRSVASPAVNHSQSITPVVNHSAAMASPVVNSSSQSVTSPVVNSSSQNVTPTTMNHLTQAPAEKKVSPSVAPPVVNRSWADVLKSKNSQSQPSTPSNSISDKTEKGFVKLVSDKESETISSSIEEDKVSLLLGRHLYSMGLDYKPIFLQPRGLINRRNWCYINASLQALLACSPFYTLLRNLPLGPGVDRGKSCTPVLDSMVKLVYEFRKVSAAQEDMKPGNSFQPTQIYEMLSTLKPDCIKGQQEDAEEFLSYILNGMHEEMVAVIKNFERHNGYDVSTNSDVTTNGHPDFVKNEDEWKVMGARQKGVVTRLVAEHKSPISELLGGQIKSFLTTNNGNTSASIQPFFTLQLDIQSENVTSVKEALNQMTTKEPIQGYTCAKTKQEVEAYSRITIQKLPPVLILHLKRFIYDKDGGCKKVMKKTEYPIDLELKKELFSPEAKRANKLNYTLFAVMYHDGEEAIKGHYISDIYHHGSKSWIRCDDRSIAAITEDQVLSYNPPRVPYLLFYQINNSDDTTL